MSLASPIGNSESAARMRVRVRGAVQGVGFRPFVYWLARGHGLSGWILNDGEGVLLEVEGARIEGFVEDLRRKAPPLARIDAVETERVTVCGETGFAIRESVTTAVKIAIGPDACVCEACLTELFDPNDRRYRYPFLNCTHCGPRFTITARLPYDRPSTSMGVFPMCPLCAREYHDPADRRFHAQPTACPDCGPRLSMPVEAILARLRDGEIIAIKGLGGFHLACDARNEGAVAALRRRKNREEKPFAVMAAGLASVRSFAQVDPQEATLLTSRERPIVLLPSRNDAGLAPSIAPGLPWVGAMLPYTPLHYLLFHEAAGRPDGIAWLEQVQPLVLLMTSANPGEEPLVIANDEARRRLSHIADTIVDHDRDILVRADDSVMRMTAGAPRIIRRARGYVPCPIKLARPVAPIVAVGGHLKSTICVTRGDEAYLSQHIGDVNNWATFGFLKEAVEHLLSILEVTPSAVAHDLHPDFLSTRYAESLGLPLIPVQHHHAHIAAVAAEYRIEGPLMGLALDGFGLGPEAALWGGELLIANGAEYERVGHLAPLRQPGGDRAAYEPWRMAAAALHMLGRTDEIEARLNRYGDARVIRQMLERGLNAPESTSCGRLFDAACGLLGVVPHASFEGQAPMSLEGLVERTEVLDGGWRLGNGVLDMAPLLDALIGMEAKAGAELFHGTLIAAMVVWSAEAAQARGMTRLALCGGCLLNRCLAEGLVRGLAARGVEALLPRQVPANDGGLSLGQAWVAAHAIG